MRLFVGIALAPEAAEVLLRVRERFAPLAGDLRWSEPQSWHLTLEFLGAATEEQAACLMEKLAAVRAARVPVRIAGLGFFERAGVFWAGVELAPELLALQQKVGAGTRGCGFLPEDRAYSPHITLARAKGQSGARGRSVARALGPVRAALEREKVDVKAEFMAEAFLLYESFTGPQGSRYQVRGRFALSGG